MRKYYMPPDIKLNLTRKKEPHELEGAGARQLVRINDSVEMVIPDTYEKEKWLKPEKKKEKFVHVPAPVVNKEDKNKVS